MSDIAGECVVTSITNCSPAQDAGLKAGDVIVAMDGKPLTDLRTPIATRQPACDVLRERILQHAPGEDVVYNVQRGGTRIALKASLSTRADVQHRCFVGQQMASIDAENIDDQSREMNFADLRGKTTVMAWFRLERCVGCGPVFDRIADGIAERRGEAQFIGVTPIEKGKDRPKRSGFLPSVPVWLAAEKDFRELTLQETDRIQIMVVDCHGVIRFVAPLAPGSDDLDASIDEVLAAVEQAEHLRTQRR